MRAADHARPIGFRRLMKSRRSGQRPWIARIDASGRVAYAGVISPVRTGRPSGVRRDAGSSSRTHSSASGDARRLQ
jgi:hypothetical protein